jgi:uncharacterized protein (TIGR03435 family)
MERTAVGISSIILISGLVFGQTNTSAAAPVSAPAFEAADVHVSRPFVSSSPFMSGGILRGTRYAVRNASMLNLITSAWSVQYDDIFGGPNWLELDRFDILAKAPAGTSQEAAKRMLQTLLADRFKLVAHPDSRPLPGFALVPGKSKSKLKEANDSGTPGCQFVPQKAAAEAVFTAIVSCHSVTMKDFVYSLRGYAGDYIDKTLIDATGLEGSWDFELRWSPRGLLGQAGESGISLYDAIDKQLGLKLEHREVPTPVVVVDSVNQRPSPNPPATADLLPPPPPAEFEVATVKPSTPDETLMIRILPGAQVSIKAATLKFLLTFAWDIPQDDDFVIGAPKFLDSNRFDVTGKAPAGADSAGRPQIDIDDVRQMLRTLLKDRFKLAAHQEDRPVRAYNLITLKPKMKRADTDRRTAWKEGVSLDGKDPRSTYPALSRLVTCYNMTTAQFVQFLPNIAPGYIHSPVLDHTGLEGAWDFTLSFSEPGLLRSTAPRIGDVGNPSAGNAPGAADPDRNYALSLSEALERQLGLKLEETKRPIPVLVIDHIDEQPSDN